MRDVYSKARPLLLTGSVWRARILLWVGAGAGLAGGLFSRATLAASRGLPGATGRFQKTRPVLFALSCGLVVASLGWASGGLTFGTGHAEARMATMASKLLSPPLYRTLAQRYAEKALDVESQ